MPEWIEATFLDPSSPLRKEEHAHLAHAEIFTIRGHDVEELLGVVRRYGARRCWCPSDRRCSQPAASDRERADRHACGTCQLRVALGQR